MRLFRDVLFMTGSRVTGLAFVAALNVLIARTLGPQGRGLYALPTIDCGLAATFVLGLSSALSYFILNKRAGRGVVRAALAGAALFTLAGALLTVVTALLNRHPAALLPALAYLPLYALLSLASGYSIGSDRIRYWGLINVAVPMVTLAAVGAGFLFVGKTPAVAIGGWLCGTALVGVAAAAFAFRHARGRTGEPVELRDFLRFGAKAGALNMFNVLNYRIDVYIVAAIAPLSVLGLYTVAVAGAEAAVAMAHAFSLATQPRVGSLSRADAALFTARCVRNNFLFATVLCSVAAAIAHPVVKLLFGAAFVPIVPTLRILLLGVVALSIGTVISNYFMLNAGRAAVPLATGACSALLCGAISFALVPRIGMLGAAIGTATAYIASQVISIACFCKETGIPVRRVLFVDGTDIALYAKLLGRKAFRLA